MSVKGRVRRLGEKLKALGGGLSCAACGYVPSAPREVVVRFLHEEDEAEADDRPERCPECGRRLRIRIRLRWPDELDEKEER